MNKTFYLKVGDNYPYYEYQVIDASLAPVDISGATILATMKTADGITTKFAARSAGNTIVDGPNGRAEYQWQTNDTSVAGQYQIYFKIALPSGKTFTVPVDPNISAPIEVQS